MTALDWALLWFGAFGLAYGIYAGALYFAAMRGWRRALRGWEYALALLRLLERPLVEADVRQDDRVDSMAGAAAGAVPVTRKPR